MATFDLKSPGAQKLLLSVLLAGGALGVYFSTHLLPWTFPSGSEKIADLKSQYEQKSAELARARASVADLPRFEAEYEQLHQRWEMASELLPTERQLPTLLRKITLAGQQTGVTFTMFRPGAVQPSDFHTEMPIAVSGRGRLPRGGLVPSELANMRRIVTGLEPQADHEQQERRHGFDRGGVHRIGLQPQHGAGGDDRDREHRRPVQGGRHTCGGRPEEGGQEWPQELTTWEAARRAAARCASWAWWSWRSPRWALAPCAWGSSIFRARPTRTPCCRSPRTLPPRSACPRPLRARPQRRWPPAPLAASLTSTPPAGGPEAPARRPGTRAASSGGSGSALVTAVTPEPVGASAGAGRIDEHVTYQYNALGRRDPFQSLLAGEYVPDHDEAGNAAPPDPGGMKIVGIVWGATDQFAMVEDARGNSYVLRKGDKLQNGYVESLRRDAVVVNITADGSSQTVVIPFVRKGDPNAH
jgi:Tfp pilus assembly protein PilO